MSTRSQELNDRISGPGPSVTSDHLSADQNNGGSRESRDALVTLARSQFNRSAQGDSLDLGGAEHLYGKHAIDFRPGVQVVDASHQIVNTSHQSVDTSNLGDPRSSFEQNIRSAQDNAEAKSIKVKNGDSLWKIARHNLGANATEAEVQQHVRDIAKLNGMQDPFRRDKVHNLKSDVIHPGQHLKLPGHPNHGHEPHTHSKHRFNDAHKPQYELKLNPEPAPTPKPSPERTPEQKAAPSDWVMPTDNKASPFENKPENLENEKKTEPPQSENELLNQQKQRLEQNLDTNAISDVQKQKIHDDMRQFETRAATDRIPPDEVRKTYEQVNRLYESKDDQPINHSDKQLLAQQVLYHAAHPHNIDQGQHSTCNVTTIESRLFSANPSEAAKVIADIGTAGSYTAKDGSKVSLTSNDLLKDKESLNDTPEDGERSYLSKLFQETALDLHYQSKGLGQHFEETPAASKPGDRNAYGMDKEEVVGPDGKRVSFGGISPLEMADLDAKITGKNNAKQFLYNFELPPGTENPYDKKLNAFNNQQEFHERLRDLKEHNGFPAILKVDTNKPPFSSGTDEGAGGSGGGHVVTVTGYDEKTGKVSYANQWGSSHNHLGENGVPIGQLYNATKSPQQ